MCTVDKVSMNTSTDDLNELVYIWANCTCVMDLQEAATLRTKESTSRHVSISGPSLLALKALLVVREGNQFSEDFEAGLFFLLLGRGCHFVCLRDPYTYGYYLRSIREYKEVRGTSFRCSLRRSIRCSVRSSIWFSIRSSIRIIGRNGMGWENYPKKKLLPTHRIVILKPLPSSLS